MVNTAWHRWVHSGREHTHTHTANLWVLPLSLAGPSAWLDQIRGLLVWMCEGNVRGLWVRRRSPARQKPIDSWTSKKKGERSKCIFLHSSKTSSNKRQISFHVRSVSVFACAIFITPTCLWLENSPISNWVKRTNSWLIKHFNYNHTVQILERAFLLQEQQLLYIHIHVGRGGGRLLIAQTSFNTQKDIKTTQHESMLKNKNIFEAVQSCSFHLHQ